VAAIKKMIGTFVIFSTGLLAIKSISLCPQGRMSVDARRKSVDARRKNVDARRKIVDAKRKNVDASMKKNQNATLAAKRNAINAALMGINALKTAKTQKTQLE
jgi:hypothetical protein